jgi:hypothetical protein
MVAGDESFARGTFLVAPKKTFNYLYIVVCVLVSNVSIFNTSRVGSSAGGRAVSVSRVFYILVLPVF